VEAVALRLLAKADFNARRWLGGHGAAAGRNCVQPRPASQERFIFGYGDDSAVDSLARRRSLQPTIVTSRGSAISTFLWAPERLFSLLLGCCTQHSAAKSLQGAVSPEAHCGDARTRVPVPRPLHHASP
jgi:hypothetical protein